MAQTKLEETNNYDLVYESREWLNDLTQDFINSKKHFELIYGGAGYGKSQYLAHMIHNMPDVCAYYFVDYTHKEANLDLTLPS